MSRYDYLDSDSTLRLTLDSRNVDELKKLIPLECISPRVAETIAQNSRTGKLCQRTGERGLVVPMDKEKAFRDGLNAIGYGMPQV